MKKRDIAFAVLAVLVGVVPAASQDEPPKLLYAHPDRDSDGPYWVAASYAFRPDGTVRSEKRIGKTRASSLADHPPWLAPPKGSSGLMVEMP